MQKIRLIPVLFAAMIVLPAAHADESSVEDVTADDAVPDRTVDTLFDEAAYPVRWELAEAAVLPQYANDFTWPLSDIDFEDANMISRVKSIRRLSLVTFAEIRGAQLYFGVNQNGLFGLHFGASSSGNREAQLEVMRMPYLPKLEDEDGQARD